MNTEFFNALEALEKERGIPKEYMLERVEAALISAYKKDSGGNSNVRVVLDPVKKDVKVYQLKNIVETVEDPETEISLEDAKKVSRKYTLGGVAEFEVKTKNFGRISAQTAKQVIIQGIREAERSMMIREYESKKRRSSRRPSLKSTLKTATSWSIPERARRCFSKENRFPERSSRSASISRYS